ncbi:hypothetical protein C7W93_06670 [Glaciimonas sp. PCH181]|nr:hypothetical protein C7W93_06670 [Glaciimonas sp. PCH181]
MVLPGNMDDIFRQLAKERHKAAHVPSHNVPHSQFVSALPQALTLALVFDALVSAATKRLSGSAIASGVIPAAVASEKMLPAYQEHRRPSAACLLLIYPEVTL